MRFFWKSKQIQPTVLTVIISKNRFHSVSQGEIEEPFDPCTGSDAEQSSRALKCVCVCVCIY